MGFVAVRFTEEQTNKYKDRFRISSYRWAGFKGMGPNGDQFVLPGLLALT